MRRIMLLLGLGVLGVLIWQNWSVSFAITFLFWRTPAYPLGLLILASLGLGSLLGIVLLILWSMGTQIVVKAPEPPRRERSRPQPPPEPEPEADIDDWFQAPTTTPGRESWSEARNVTPLDEQIPPPQDRYGTTEPIDVTTAAPRPVEPRPPEPRAQPERKPRRPKPRAEVVDAEFRVLTPPYTPPEPAPSENAPDWGDWLEEDSNSSEPQY